MHFVFSVLCLKQGNTIEEVVVNRVCILELFCPKQGQGLTDFSGSPIPQNGSPLGRGGLGSRLAPLTPSFPLACVTLRYVKPVFRWYIKDRRRNAECLVRSTSQLKKSPKINKLYYSLPGSFRCKTHNSEVPLYFRFPLIVTTARKCKFHSFSTLYHLFT